MNSSQFKLESALGDLRITNSTPQGYRPDLGTHRKVAPVVPPKPKKPPVSVSAAAPAPANPPLQRLPSQPLPPPPEFSAPAFPPVQDLPPPPAYLQPQHGYPQRGGQTGAAFPAAPEDDLPPPAAAGLYVDSSEFSGAGELPAPPSPVSSSYSELRRANQGAPPPSYPTDPGQFAAYAPASQTSGTYDSLYEPVRRAAAGGGGGGQTEAAAGEAELDSLTNMLVHGLDNPQPDFFGMCNKCGDKVVGEGTGCTAMEKVFHVSCFTCHVCHVLLQGRPFFAVESKPHCELCYMNTLERCSVCTKPILDRILRATGKPYHPQCLSCVVCGKPLDGISFTVDATNQIHCIEDFHRKFAPKCSVCWEPIMPEPGQQEAVRVVALDRSFHVQCYKCEDCGLVLSTEAEGRGCYPLDGHVLCKNCNAKRVRR